MEVVRTVIMAVPQRIHHVPAVVLAVHVPIVRVQLIHHPVKINLDQQIRDNKQGQQEQNVLVPLHLHHQLVQEVDLTVITAHVLHVQEADNKYYTP